VFAGIRELFDDERECAQWFSYNNWTLISFYISLKPILTRGKRRGEFERAESFVAIPLPPYTLQHQSLKNTLPDHHFLYTDGSMANGIIIYSVINETNAIKSGYLPHYSSVLSSELIAI